MSPVKIQHNYTNSCSGQKSKLKCHQNLITSRGHQNTNFYQVASISD